ncbi:TraR/DksA family transcriptional regulator [Streptomyces sp. NPDC001797]|uniref:TraR/DksA family transcriptional regulator n=1 Tax=Streptomyces sp. NPDC001797 TaxID=3364610 RepID=UPI0036B990CE
MSDNCSDAAFPAPQGESMRALLAADRVGTLEQISALGREYEGIVEANALVAIDDEHDPEGASTAFERAHVAALLSQAREHLNDLDRALERLERGDYGRCERCGEPIPTERLEVRPAAETCVRCASAAR